MNDWLVTELRIGATCGASLAGFPVTSVFRFGGGGRGAVCMQRFVDDETYRAARRGVLTSDRLISKRRYESWGAWAQDCIKARPGEGGCRMRAMIPACGQLPMMRDCNRTYRPWPRPSLQPHAPRNVLIPGASLPLSPPR